MKWIFEKTKKDVFSLFLIICNFFYNNFKMFKHAGVPIEKLTLFFQVVIIIFLMDSGNAFLYSNLSFWFASFLTMIL